MYQLYGIKNCDTVKKARKWLEQHEVSYQFHDFRVDGLDKALLARFETALGWQTLLNKRSTSWRQLDETQKNDLSADKAIKLMLENPTLIKRPVLEANNQFLIGFNTENYQDLL